MDKVRLAFIHPPARPSGRRGREVVEAGVVESRTQVGWSAEMALAARHRLIHQRVPILTPDPSPK